MRLQARCLAESFTIHARNLLQFFYPGSSIKPDEMRADHYVVDWKRIRGKKPQPLTTVMGRVATEIVHLTYDRVDIGEEAKRWNPAEIHAAIAMLVERFVRTIEPHYLAALNPIDDPVVIVVADPLTASTAGYAVKPMKPER